MLSFCTGGGQRRNINWNSVGQKYTCIHGENNIIPAPNFLNFQYHLSNLNLSFFTVAVVGLENLNLFCFDHPLPKAELSHHRPSMDTPFDISAALQRILQDEQVAYQVNYLLSTFISPSPDLSPSCCDPRPHGAHRELRCRNHV